ncbi:MAG: ATP-binding cassette domain-containing protein, partial [Rhodobacteraceae bacterium]|nr:ATP-binding cassette domain-containing protein [Paracoccaceae bacterium]
MTDNALTIRSVDKFRGKTKVLKAIDLVVAPGERVALLGHNGAGKSTLIKMILGQTSIDGGDISIGDAKPGSTVARARTAFLPESVNFHPTLTGHEQLTLFARLSGRDLP